MKGFALLALSLTAIGCSKGSSTGGDAPPRPSTGAPVAAEISAFKPGPMFQSEATLKLYNFSDKSTGAYELMLRSYDASGKRLVYQPESPLDHEVYAIGGPKFVCKAHTWCTFTIQPGIPAGTAKIEVFAKSVSATKAEDPLAPEREPMFKLPTDTWPGSNPGGQPAAAPPAPAPAPAPAQSATPPTP